MNANDKAYKMYKQLNYMSSKVFDIYHDHMYDIMGQIRCLSDEDNCEDELKVELDKMSNLLKSAQYMNKAYGV